MSPLLLDTCALLALASGTLPEKSIEAIGITSKVYVSTASAWEVAIKHNNKKLTLPEDPFNWFKKVSKHFDLDILILDPETVCKAAALPDIHKDPFDRVLVATAILQGLTLVTSDSIIPQYKPTRIIWN